jgi:hypothetical protein
MPASGKPSIGAISCYIFVPLRPCHTKNDHKLVSLRKGHSFFLHKKWSLAQFQLVIFKNKTTKTIA